MIQDVERLSSMCLTKNYSRQENPSRALLLGKTYYNSVPPQPPSLSLFSTQPLIDLLTMSTTLDVTASFAASLALASGNVIDISHMDHAEEPRPNPRMYLLACVIASKHVSPMDLQSHFKCIWLITRHFRVQARGKSSASQKITLHHHFWSPKRSK